MPQVASSEGTRLWRVGGQRVEAFQSDFAFYRGLDFILGRRYQVDPDAESYYNMSPYCAMDD
ncbi:MAG: hypothetical protein IPJ13_23770 [Saprospiraceae bacterium]|nr:hypothetical protein [Saprospiraceae bacterium]